MAINRRDFLSGVASACGATVLGSVAGLNSKALFASEASSTPALMAPDQSGINHIVVVTMENRSFDHFLGWLPGANGKQAGLSYVDPNGVSHSTYPLAPDYTGCPHPDPDHSYSGGRIDYDGGAMDGFLKNPANDIFAIGYYTKKDIPFYAALASLYDAQQLFLLDPRADLSQPNFPVRGANRPAG